MDCVAGMWTSSFFEAMRQLQVEALKGKIQKAWGAKMDKAADGVVETMGAQWQAMVAQAKAKSDFKQRLASLLQEK